MKKTTVNFKSDKYPNTVWEIDFDDGVGIEIIKINGLASWTFDRETVQGLYTALSAEISSPACV